MSRRVDQAIQNCVEAVNIFEANLAKRGITLDEWLANPELRGIKNENANSKTGSKGVKQRG